MRQGLPDGMRLKLKMRRGTARQGDASCGTRGAGKMCAGGAERSSALPSSRAWALQPLPKWIEQRPPAKNRVEYAGHLSTPRRPFFIIQNNPHLRGGDAHDAQKQRGGEEPRGRHPASAFDGPHSACKAL